MAGPPVMPPGIQSKCDAQLAVLLPEIAAQAEAFREGHGGYWQGLATHSTLPQDGQDELPDVGDLTPTDQTDDPWPVALLQTPFCMAVTVDCYDGPQGVGYVVRSQIELTPPQAPVNMVWERADNVGPESGWAHDWEPVPESETVP